MTCHEKWCYDDKLHTATLVGFEIHCSNCDLATHSGRAFNLGYGDIVISQLCAVNRWKPEEAVNALKDAMKIWEKRSKRKWKIKVAAVLVSRYPELKALPKFDPPIRVVG